MDRKGADYLHSAQHIGLKELLIAVGVVDQGAVVHNGDHIAAELLVGALLQAKAGLCKISCMMYNTPCQIYFLGYGDLPSLMAVTPNSISSQDTDLEQPDTDRNTGVI